MKSLLLLAALTLGLAPAQAVDTKGIPAEQIGGFFHLGLRNLHSTKFGQVLDKAFRDEARANRTFRAFEQKLGFDFEKDIHDVVVGFYPGADPKKPLIAGVLHGRFDVAKIEAYAKAAKVPTATFGSQTAWDFEYLTQHVAREDGEEMGLPISATWIVFVSADTALIGGTPNLAAIREAYAGKSASFRPKADLSGPGAPFLRVEVDLEMLKTEDANGLRKGVLTVGETGPNLVATLDGQVTSPGKATQLASQLKGMAGLISLGLMDEANKTADQLAAQRAMLELLQSLKAEAKGDHAVFALSYDAEKAAMGIVKAVVAEKIKATVGK
ncbi:hypothetical protein EMGBS10_18820 [Opitutia bacterium]|nr:hypothetical protein EMGBS10_18820 [Opitutae bacterium]